MQPKRTNYKCIKDTGNTAITEVSPSTCLMKKTQDYNKGDIVTWVDNDGINIYMLEEEKTRGRLLYRPSYEPN